MIHINGIDKFKTQLFHLMRACYQKEVLIMNFKLKREHLGWVIWIVAAGAMYWMGTDRFHLKHHTTFLVLFVILVAAMLIAFRVLERRKGNSNPPQDSDG